MTNNDYPLCPGKIKISSDMLSKYCGDIANKYGIKVWWSQKIRSKFKRSSQVCSSLQKSSVLFIIGNEVD